MRGGRRVAVSGIVLAGGEGNRLGGADKGLLDLGGAPMVAFVIATMRSVCDEVVISANRNVGRYADLADTVVGDRADAAVGSDGPLAGLHAALGIAQGDTALVAPCDMPWLDRRVFESLLAALDADRNVAAAAAFDGARFQPLVLALRTELADALAAWLDGGGRAVHEWLGHIGAATVTDPRPERYRNVNTTVELERARAQFCSTVPGHRGAAG